MEGHQHLDERARLDSGAPVPLPTVAVLRVHGKHLDRVQKMKHGSKDYAALLDLLVRSWTHAALMSLSPPPLSSEAAQGT